MEKDKAIFIGVIAIVAVVVIWLLMRKGKGVIINTGEGEAKVNSLGAGFF